METATTTTAMFAQLVSLTVKSAIPQVALPALPLIPFSTIINASQPARLALLKVETGV